MSRDEIFDGFGGGYRLVDQRAKSSQIDLRADAVNLLLRLFDARDELGRRAVSTHGMCRAARCRALSSDP